MYSEVKLSASYLEVIPYLISVISFLIISMDFQRPQGAYLKLLIKGERTKL